MRRREGTDPGDDATEPAGEPTTEATADGEKRGQDATTASVTPLRLTPAATTVSPVAALEQADRVALLKKALDSENAKKITALIKENKQWKVTASIQGDKKTGETRRTEHYYFRHRGKRYPTHIADKRAAEAKARAKHSGQTGVIEIEVRDSPGDATVPDQNGSDSPSPRPRRSSRKW